MEFIWITPIYVLTLKYKVLFVVKLSQMNNTSTLSNLTGWIFGTAVLLIGLVNMFWGNDPGFGAFILMLSLVYFPPVNNLIRQQAGLSIHWPAKIILALLIAWVALGVGELPAKIGLMMKNF